MHGSSRPPQLLHQPCNHIRMHTHASHRKGINMPITITATFSCADITEYDEVMSLVRDNEPINITVSGSVDFDYDAFADEADLTPPIGLSRADVDHAISVHISALVAWTIENVTSGPLTEVPRQVLREAFRRLLDDDGADLGNLVPSSVRASCVRGAFRDAQAGMVPL
jgi:hypothetical protein